MIGLEKNIVKLVDYNSEWKKLFSKEREKLQEKIGNDAVYIEHIGSTAVPGLCAKPIIDMLVGIDTLEQLESFIDLMRKNGYEYKGEYGVNGRFFFVKNNDRYTTHHLHMVLYNSQLWKKYITFRNRLVKNDQIKNKYARLKRSLAKKYFNDRPAYTESKTDFILGVLAENAELRAS